MRMSHPCRGSYVQFHFHTTYVYTNTHISGVEHKCDMKILLKLSTFIFTGDNRKLVSRATFINEYETNIILKGS